MTYSVLSLLVMILDIYVIVLIFQSSMDLAKKLIWLLLVLILPVAWLETAVSRLLI